MILKLSKSIISIYKSAALLPSVFLFLCLLVSLQNRLFFFLSVLSNFTLSPTLSSLWNQFFPHPSPPHPPPRLLLRLLFFSFFFFFFIGLETEGVSFLRVYIICSSLFMKIIFWSGGYKKYSRCIWGFIIAPFRFGWIWKWNVTSIWNT